MSDDGLVEGLRAELKTMRNGFAREFAENCKLQHDIEEMRLRAMNAERAVNAAVLLKHWHWTKADDVPAWARGHADYPGHHDIESAAEEALWARIPDTFVGKRKQAGYMGDVNGLGCDPDVP